MSWAISVHAACTVEQAVLARFSAGSDDDGASPGRGKSGLRVGREDLAVRNRDTLRRRQQGETVEMEIRSGGAATLAGVGLPEEVVLMMWPRERLLEGMLAGSSELKGVLLCAQRVEGLGEIPGDQRYWLSALLARMSDLRHLDLSLSKLGRGSQGRRLQFLEPLAALTRLTHLDLSSSQMCIGSISLSTWLRKLSSLRSLSLANNGFYPLRDASQQIAQSEWLVGGKGEALVSSLQMLTSLHTLLLNNNELCDQTADEIARALVGHRNLCTLDLSDNTLGHLGLDAISELAGHLSALTSLGLGGCSASLGSALHVPSMAWPKRLGESLQCFTSLRSLDLGRNPIDDDGITHLACALARHTKLETLKLDMTDLGAGGMLCISTSLPFAKHSPLPTEWTQAVDEFLFNATM